MGLSRRGFLKFLGIGAAVPAAPAIAAGAVKTVDSLKKYDWPNPVPLKPEVLYSTATMVNAWGYISDAKFPGVLMEDNKFRVFCDMKDQDASR